jgi:uncharacterized membrane protein
MARGGAMIAHQGGWDEILLVLGPIAVIIGLLMLARKRVEATEQKTAAQTSTQTSEPVPKTDH